MSQNWFQPLFWGTYWSGSDDFRPKESFSEGQRCPNLFCEFTQDFDSGLYLHDFTDSEPESQHFAQDYSELDQENFKGAFLSDIIKQIQDSSEEDEIFLHWIACRAYFNTDWMANRGVTDENWMKTTMPVHPYLAHWWNQIICCCLF